jgi:hypothetical protein
MAPFIQLTKKDQPYPLGVEVKNAFQSLKGFFTIAPLLIHVNPSKPYVLETNTSNFATGSIYKLEKTIFFILSAFVFVSLLL